MAEPKKIVKPSAAVQSPVPAATAPKADAKVETWRFVKMHTVGEVLNFPDGSTYQFRAIKRNDGSGFLPTSELFTSDAKLAENLRQAEKAGVHGVLEVKKG